MASAVLSSLSVVAPSSAPVDARPFSALKPSTFLSSKAPPPLSSVSNGHRVSCMKVWEPYNNKRFETLSYLPPLSKDEIAKQVSYITDKGWIPCLEFDNIGHIYREHFHGSGYYDGRYWTMWKLPMFGCNDSSVVLREITECEKAYPNAYVRVLGFDRNRQVQVCGFVVHRPAHKQ